MLTIDRTRTISRLAFPVGIALSSDLVMSLIDIAMVGKLGNNAIAAAGLSSFSNALVLAFVSGMALAVQGLVARGRGESSGKPTCAPLNGGLLIALAVGIPLTVVSYLLTPLFFSVISSDPEVTRIGIPFLRTLYIAIAAVAMNSAFKGYWAGMEKPQVYMLIALFMNCLNIAVNYVLIFGHFGAPALGATGAAIGTTSALYAGVIINCAILYLRHRKDGFLNARPERSILARIFRIGAPATLQQFFFSAGYIVFLWLIGRIGTAELAAANVLVRITMVFVLLALSLGSASATLVSKTLGEGDLAGAAQWGWDTGKLGFTGSTLLALPLLLFPGLFLSIFISDPHTIEIASLPLRFTAASAGMASLIYVFAHILYTVGDGNRVMMISFSTQWLFFLPAVWFVGPHLHYGLVHIWFVQAIYGVIATVWITAVWADGRWKRIQI
jgi:putative MATE family efflux protein